MMPEPETFPHPDALLVLPHLRVQNANAISSPLTWGFPSPSAFTGFVHALHRRISTELDLELGGVGIVCHDFDAQVSAPTGRRTKVFHLTRNPLKSDGRTAAIVEEGRAHIDVSLVIGATGAALYSGLSLDMIAGQLDELALSMRLAGGSIFAGTPPRGILRRPEVLIWPGTPEDEHRFNRSLKRRLLPGFALVSREAILEERWDELKEENPLATSLDALLEMSSLNIDPPATEPSSPAEVEEEASEPARRREWTVRERGYWLVPIPAGYHALSDLYQPGEVRNARDPETPFRFVESLYTVGQWLSPHRIDDIRKILWIHTADPRGGLYRWTTPYFAHLPSSGGD